MKKTLLMMLSIVAACSIGACSSSPDDAPPSDQGKPSLNLTSHTPTFVEGTFSGGAASLSFKSVEQGHRKAEVTVRADDTTVVLHLDFAHGQGDMGATGTLEQAQIQAMPQLMTALAGVLPKEDTTVTDALGRTLNLLSEVRPAEPLPSFSFVAEKGWAYIRCACQVQDAQGYHNWMGWSESCGGNHCPGRCGVGCGWDNIAWSNRWGSGSYTADCAKHDYGQVPIEVAADDYAFASDNCANPGDHGI